MNFIKISLQFVPKGPINNIPALVQIMAWCRPGDKPLYEPMMVRLPMHICVTRPQWVNNSLILPYISYLIHIWGKAYETHLKNVLVLQKEFLRVLLLVYHHIQILTTCLFNLISFLSKSSMSVLLVLLCINMIMKCFLNCFVIVYRQTDGWTVGRTYRCRQRQYPFGLRGQGVKIYMCLSNLFREARNLWHLVDIWCGILLQPKWTLDVLYDPSNNCCSRYYSCISLLVYLVDHVSPDNDSQTIAV